MSIVESNSSSTDPSKKSAQTRTTSSSPPVEESYKQLRIKYKRLQEKLEKLVILDKDLQEAIKLVRQQMLAIKKEYETAMTSHQKLLAQTGSAEDRAIYESAPNSIIPKIEKLDQQLGKISKEITRGLNSEALARPDLIDDQPKVRAKTPNEILLETTKSNDHLAQQYTDKTIAELQKEFKSLQDIAKNLKMVGAWMLVISIYGNQLEAKIPKEIAEYKKLDTPDSTILVTKAPGRDLQSVASREINRIANNIFSYSKRIEWLQKLEKEVHQLTTRIKSKEDFKIQFPQAENEIKGLADNLADLINKKLKELEEVELNGKGKSKSLVNKSPGADAFVRALLTQLQGAQAPNSPESLVNLLSILLLNAVLKKSEAKSLEKKDVKELKLFFHSDRFSSMIDKSSYDDSMKNHLKNSLDTLFRIAQDVEESALFS